MLNKKGFEFSFGWLFAIIVGATIIFLAIYGVMNFVKISRTSSDTILGKELSTILAPIETGVESLNKPAPIVFPVEARAYNDCETAGNFGKQKIRIATKSGIGEEWQSPGAPSIFYNKYIFSESTIEGKSIIAFSKPLNFPYKIANLVFLWGDKQKYCFVNSPQSIEDELFGVKNINFTSDSGKCSKNSKKVCFSGTGCDIMVDLTAQSVKKDRRTIYFAQDSENVLLYGAIFADSGIYECQLKRLMKRASELALIYKAKSESLSPRGCSSGLEGELINYANETSALNNSVRITELELSADRLRRNNEALSCKLF